MNINIGSMQCVEREFSWEIKNIQKRIIILFWHSSDIILTPEMHTSACEARVGAIRVEEVLAAHTRVVVVQVDARGVRRAHLIGWHVAVRVFCRGIQNTWFQIVHFTIAWWFSTIGCSERSSGVRSTLELSTLNAGWLALRESTQEVGNALMFAQVASSELFENCSRAPANQFVHWFAQNTRTPLAHLRYRIRIEKRAHRCCWTAGAESPCRRSCARTATAAGRSRAACSCSAPTGRRRRTSAHSTSARTRVSVLLSTVEGRLPEAYKPYEATYEVAEQRAQCARDRAGGRAERLGVPRGHHQLQRACDCHCAKRAERKWRVSRAEEVALHWRAKGLGIERSVPGPDTLVGACVVVVVSCVPLPPARRCDWLLRNVHTCEKARTCCIPEASSRKAALMTSCRPILICFSGALVENKRRTAGSGSACDLAKHSNNF